MGVDAAKRAGFPTLEPAIEVKVPLTGQLPCGDIYTGSTLIGVTLGEGTVKSIQGFEPKLDFKVANGHDWFRIDADKQHGRLCITAIAADAEGRCMRVLAEGTVELNEHTMPLIMGAPDAKTAPFGSAVEQIRFECGHEPYKAIEAMIFAGSMRFVKEETGLSAEIRLSKIVAGSGYA